ncbi:hypothetical protein [Planctomycetes bacterium CA13]
MTALLGLDTDSQFSVSLAISIPQSRRRLEIDFRFVARITNHRQDGHTHLVQGIENTDQVRLIFHLTFMIVIG